MNITPMLSIVGATLVSMSVFKWILLGFVGLLVLWIMSSSRTSRAALEAKAVKDLVKSASQWNARSLQDTNAIIAMMNANYAMAYLNMAKSIATEDEVDTYAGHHVKGLADDIEASQRSAFKRLVGTCPSLVPKGSEHTGWM